MVGLLGTACGGGSAGGNDGGGGDAGDPADAFVPPDFLPEAPPLEGLRTVVDGDRVAITFDPVAGARDYRVYELPSEDALRVEADGRTVVTDGTYRCAGDREASRMELNGGSAGGWMYGLTEGDVQGFERADAGKRLGWVALHGGDGLTPVYALGDPAPEADNDCGGEVWASSRRKRYVVGDAARDALLADGWRDDGIAFYTSDGARRPLRRTTSDGATLYYVDGPERDARGDGEVDFSIFDVEADELVPLYRIYMGNGCGRSNDELIAGDGRYERISYQGNQPLWEVQWSGLTASTTLVVEALDAGCPFQGHLSASDLPASGNHQPFVSVATVRAAAPDGEVFVNGQHDPASRPKAIARGFVVVAPATPPAMDFRADFGAAETFTPVDERNYGGQDVFLDNATFEASYYSIEPASFSIGVVAGELWSSFADWASDTNGKFRLTPKARATLADGTFIHATMQVDLWSTGRRYPQLWISDVDTPVQDNMTNGVTLNVQTIDAWPTQLQVQLCDHESWDVNAQCPAAPIQREAFSDAPWVPLDVVGEHAGVARLAQLDVYASTARTYVFLDGRPHACVDLPAGAFAPGTATVTFGDVLYHSGVDEPVVPKDTVYVFHRDRMLTETRRHYDGLGFSSGVAAPGWDESRFPCVAF